MIFDFGPHLLNRIEVRRVRRQEPSLCSYGFNGLHHAVRFVTGKIVHHDDVARAEHWNQEVIDESLKDQGVGRPFGDHCRGHALQANRGDHRGRVPMTAGDRIEESFSLQSPSVLPCHVGLGAALIQENQTLRIDLCQLPLPSLTLFLYFGAILFAGT